MIKRYRRRRSQKKNKAAASRACQSDLHNLHAVSSHATCDVRHGPLFSPPRSAPHGKFTSAGFEVVVVADDEQGAAAVARDCAVAGPSSAASLAPD